MDSCKHLLNDPIAVELALWYHDVIYSVNSITNENNSALFFYRHAISDFDIEFIKRVQSYIRYTKHTTIPEENDAKYVLDIDLAILGSDKYSEYKKNVRSEYLKAYSSIKYNLGRKLFLNALLLKKSLYLTKFFREKYEKIARENISLEIEEIS